MMAAAAFVSAFVIMKKVDEPVEFVRSLHCLLLRSVQVVPVIACPEDAVDDRSIHFIILLLELGLDPVPDLETSRIPSSCNALSIYEVCKHRISLGHLIVDLLPVLGVESLVYIPELSLPERTILYRICIVLALIPCGNLLEKSRFVEQVVHKVGRSASHPAWEILASFDPYEKMENLSPLIVSLNPG